MLALEVLFKMPFLLSIIMHGFLNLIEVVKGSAL